MHSSDVVNSIKTPGNAGLIRYERYRDIRAVERGYRLGCAINELNSVDRPDVSMVNDDRAIPIKQ